MLEGFVATDDAKVGAAVVWPWDNTLGRFVRVWDLTTGNPLHELPEVASSVAIDPRGAHVAVVTMAGGVNLHEVAHGKRVASFDPHAGRVECRFSPDGARLACVGAGVRILDVRNRSAVCSASSEATAPDALSHDGKLLAAASGSSLVLVRLDDCSVRTFDVGDAPVALALHPAGFVAAATSAGEVRLHRVADGQLVATLRIARGAVAATIGGGVEVFGDAALGARFVRCRARGYSFPLELCVDRFGRPGALAGALR
jgi:WD40 repeat protein